MDRKEIVAMCMESPLYFTMPVKMRLELVKGREELSPSNGIRDDILIWVKTGFFEFSGSFLFK